MALTSHLPGGTEKHSEIYANTGEANAHHTGMLPISHAACRMPMHHAPISSHPLFLYIRLLCLYLYM